MIEIEGTLYTSWEQVVQDAEILSQATMPHEELRRFKFLFRNNLAKTPFGREVLQVMAVAQ